MFDQILGLPFQQKPNITIKINININIHKCSPLKLQRNVKISLIKHNYVVHTQLYWIISRFVCNWYIKVTIMSNGA